MFAPAGMAGVSTAEEEGPPPPWLPHVRRHVKWRRGRIRNGGRARLVVPEVRPSVGLTWDGAEVGRYLRSLRCSDLSPCCIWTFPTGITPDETIAGYENDGYGVNHGFVRTRDGNITLFDAPGAGTGYFQGTVAVSINAGRVITGFYVDSTGAWHGFVRIPH